METAEEDRDVEKCNFEECETPSEAQKRIIIANVIAQGEGTIINKHFHEFNNLIYKSKNKGPIGSKCSGSISRVIMLWWDKRFLDLLSSLNLVIYLYSRYVDDRNFVSKAIPKNMKYDRSRKKMIECEVIDDDNNDKHTFREIRKIADDVITMFQWEETVPSDQEDARLPILDLKVWVEEVAHVLQEADGQV